MVDYTKIKVGDRLSHKRFGNGTVKDVLPINGDVIVTIEFDDGTVKKLCAIVADFEYCK